MRAYHFLSAVHALDDIANRHIKISQIDKLNDPFELWCSAQQDEGVRAALRAWKREMGKRFGVLCFSKGWHNPVMWSHYADRHHGISLGFDVSEPSLQSVRYLRRRSPLGPSPTRAEMSQLLYTKYRDWFYEQELRAWFRLDECQSVRGHYFHAFDQQMQLREVIVGPLCTTLKSEIDAALDDDKVEVIKARLAFTSFKVVANRRGFSSSGYRA